MKFNPIPLLCVLLWGSVAQASALLKPTTGATQALRAKTLEVRAEVTGAFARTTATTTYANPNTGQIEADFIYTAPQNATVTGFAYWFKGEKVVARVVEKERAAEIYQLITVRRRDPALVEMIGKNTFRARIAPVEAGADLKIEVIYVAPLDATKDGWRWTFPLGQDTENHPLAAVNFSAKIAGKTSATSNFGAFTGGELSVKKRDVKDADDIRLDVAAARAPLKISLFAARDSGADGFFAIALAPDFSATKPSFAVAGVQTYDIMRDENARAGQTFVAVGRYRGAGEALVKLGQRSVKVNFAQATTKNNIAAQMWGARRIETLSKSEVNRAAVVNLSKRFGMPSKWTSWLALPASEKAQFERQLLNLEINRALGAWAQSVALGDKKREKILRQRAYDYRKRLNKLNGQSENLSAEVFRDALNNELNRVVSARDEKSANKAKLARLERNLRRRGAVSYREIDAAQQRRYSQRRAIESGFYKGYNLYLDALQSGETKSAARLLAKNDRAFAQLKRLQSGNSYDSRPSWAGSRVSQLALQVETERKQGIADSPRQRQLLEQIRRLVPASKMTEELALSQAKSQVYAANLRKAYNLLNKEVAAGRETEAEAIRIQNRIAELKPFVDADNDYQRYSNLDQAYLNLASQQGVEYLRALDAGETQKSDALLKRIKENVERGQKYSEPRRGPTVDIETVFKGSWNRIKSDANEELAIEITAKRENSPAANKARDLVKRADANGANNYGYSYNSYMPIFAWKGRAHETAYRLIEAQQNGDSKTVEALQAQLKIEVENAGETPLDDYIEWEKSRIKNGEPIITSENYSLRPGDPLISVAAPANCQRVVAILPSGELLPLVYDAAKGAWQARFDVPTYAGEGAYHVQIIIVDANGTRRQMTMTFHVDVTVPDGKGGAIWGENGLNLQLQTDEQTDRVSAFTPWNERIELRRDASGIFVARAQVPQSWRDKSAKIRFVLTDKAHNRTAIEVDWSR